MRRNLKTVEHRKRCRVCWDRWADLKVLIGHRKNGKPAYKFYCAADYHAIFQTPAPDQSPVHLTGEDIAAALSAPTRPPVSARQAIAALERSAGGRHS